MSFRKRVILSAASAQSNTSLQSKHNCLAKLTDEVSLSPLHNASQPQHNGTHGLGILLVVGYQQYQAVIALFPYEAAHSVL